MQPNQPTQQQQKGQAQMPQQQFTASHNHIYETLRQNLMQLYKSGVPGMDSVLHALNKAHVDQLKNGQQQPQMPPSTGQMMGQPGMPGAMGQQPQQPPQMAAPAQQMPQAQMPQQGGM